MKQNIVKKCCWLWVAELIKVVMAIGWPYTHKLLPCDKQQIEKALDEIYMDICRRGKLPPLEMKIKRLHSQIEGRP